MCFKLAPQWNDRKSIWKTDKRLLSNLNHTFVFCVVWLSKNSYLLSVFFNIKAINYFEMHSVFTTRGRHRFWEKSLWGKFIRKKRIKITLRQWMNLWKRKNFCIKGQFHRRFYACNWTYANHAQDTNTKFHGQQRLQVNEKIHRKWNLSKLAITFVFVCSM